VNKGYPAESIETKLEPPGNMPQNVLKKGKRRMKVQVQVQ
jgi:phage replication-related protein YjqB (UPF0714/DUF867 family)